MKVNLHLHSKFSDGVEWPEDIASRAKNIGLDVVSLTDHDSMEGVPRFLSACRKLGMEAIAGVEIDCIYKKIGFDNEILGYFPHGKFKKTWNFLKERLIARKKLMETYIDRAKGIFGSTNISMLGLDKFISGDNDLRQKKLELFSYNKFMFFNYLKKQEIIEDIIYPKFKSKYFVVGKLLAETETKPHAIEIVDLIKSDGGYPVIAHPGFLFIPRKNSILPDEEKILAKFKEFSKIGVWGVELYYYGSEERSKNLNHDIKKIAGKIGFKFTYGSDCHGLGSSNDTMGKFSGDFKIIF